MSDTPTAVSDTPEPSSTTEPNDSNSPSSQDASADSAANNPHQQPSDAKYNFEFTGEAGEYFRIWIVNLLLTIVTLGIYSAWAKVRDNRYIYGSTKLAGSSFEYTAEPLQILKGRLIAVALFAIYQAVSVFYPALNFAALAIIVALIPAAIVLSMQFRHRNSVWRGIRFSFAPNFRQAYKLFSPVIIVFALLAMLTLVFDFSSLNPDASSDSADNNAGDPFGNDTELVENAEYSSPEDIRDFFSENEAISDNEALSENEALSDNEAFSDIEDWSENEAWGEDSSEVSLPEGLQTALITIAALYGFAVFLFPLWQALYFRFLANNSHYGRSVFELPISNTSFYKLYSLSGAIFFAGAMLSAAFGPLSFIVFIGAAIIANAYFSANKINLLYGNLSLEGVHFESALETMPMAWLYFTNSIAIVASLGLLIPWARIRTLRYRASQTRIYSVELDSFLNRSTAERNALGEEIGEVFGLDIGL